MKMINSSDFTIKVPVELFAPDARPAQPVVVEPGGTVEIWDEATRRPEYVPNGVPAKSAVERQVPQLRRVRT